MKIDEILFNHVNRKGSDEHARQIGRYWATDIYAIEKGYLMPSDFFLKKPIEMEGVRKILRGVADEKMLEEIFTQANVDFEYQAKKEIQITDEIVLVAKPDFVFPEFILETKFIFKDYGGIPARYLYQLETYYRGFYLPIYMGKFRMEFGLELVPFVPNKRRWEKIKSILKDFHEKLKTNQGQLI
jgi:hypothetical protein